MEAVLDAGADDVVDADGAWEITCKPADMHSVRESLVGAGIEPDSAQIIMLPQNTVQCDAGTSAKVLRLLDSLDDHDDVQKVHHNAELQEPQ